MASDDLRRKNGTFWAIMIACIASISTVLAAPGAANDKGAQWCASEPDQPDLVVLQPDDFGGCVDLRSIDETIVLALTNKSPFGSGCPVTIQHSIINDPKHKTNCMLVKNALERGERLRVDDWGKGNLELTIRGPNGYVVSHVPLVPTEFDWSDGKRTKVGYYADVTHPDFVKPVRYHIYLAYRATEQERGNRVLSKYYVVEVFDPSDKCRAEEASAKISKLVDCATVPVLDPKNPNVRQLPSGGGGEPPPKPGS